MDSILLFWKRPQPKQHLCPFAQRARGSLFISELGEVFLDDVVNHLTILATVDLDDFAFAAEQLKRRQRLFFKGVETKFDAFGVVVVTTGELR